MTTVNVNEEDQTVENEVVRRKIQLYSVCWCDSLPLLWGEGKKKRSVEVCIPKRSMWQTSCLSVSVSNSCSPWDIITHSLTGEVNDITKMVRSNLLVWSLHEIEVYKKCKKVLQAYENHIHQTAAEKGWRPCLAGGASIHSLIRQQLLPLKRSAISFFITPLDRTTRVQYKQGSQVVGSEHRTPFPPRPEHVAWLNMASVLGTVNTLNRIVLLSSLVYALYFLSRNPSPLLSKPGGGLWNYWTNWTALTSILFYFLALVCDIFSYLKFRIDDFSHRALIYHGFVVPMGVSVVAAFWLLTFIDPELVVPAAVKAFLPDHINHILVSFSLFVPNVCQSNMVTFCSIP